MYKKVDSTSKSELYFKLNRGLFIMAQGLEKSLCGIFENVSSIDISTFIREAKAEISSIVEYKIIGLENSINKAKAEFGLQSISNLKVVPRNSVFEIYYLPTQNKIRVSKEVLGVANAPSVKEAVKSEIKVLIVDDSKTIRNLLTKMLTSVPGIIVCAEASKPSEVEDLIKEHKPDVITLDIHMPEMTGVELLKIIAPKYNIPTIMVTSISMAEGPLVLEALESGAFDYIQKPEMKDLPVVRPLLIEKIREASGSAKIISTKASSSREYISDYNPDSIIVLGASTGGTNAIKDILTKFPKNIPPMLIVQHIPPVFSKAFADRMNSLCPFNVREARDGDILERNLILVAPGGKQMKVVSHGAGFKVEINDDEPVNRFKPSVDYMFNSVVETCRKKHIVGILLTGMGKDGARGLLNLRKNGALTIAQDEESSVVYGMPKEAKDIGAAIAIEHKDDIAMKIGEFSWQTKAAS